MPFVPGGRGGRGGGVRTDPQMLAAGNTTLKQLIIYAYRLSGYQVSGGPLSADRASEDLRPKPGLVTNTKAELPPCSA
jgi:hypothetical protein